MSLRNYRRRINKIEKDIFKRRGKPFKKTMYHLIRKLNPDMKPKDLEFFKQFKTYVDLIKWLGNEERTFEKH